MRWTRIVAVMAMVLWGAGCDEVAGGGADTTSPVPQDVRAGEDASRAGPDLRSDTSVAPDVTPDAPPAEVASPPAGPPPVQAYSGGECPALTAGTNTMRMDGRMRSFELYLPDSPAGAPVVFLWHGNGGDGAGLADYFDAAAVAASQGVIVVAPESCCNDGHDDCCDISMTWNMGTYSKQEADLAVFDDVLACLEGQFDIDNHRVYTTGFSAGSLWSTYLVVHRGEYLAAAAIFSGGTGLVVDYTTPGHKLPVLLAWGGANDTYMGVVDFAEMTADFSANLQADGFFVVECNHGLGHTIPYGGAIWGFDFLFMHKWGMVESPYASMGLNALYPEYCHIVTSNE